jgi:inosine-uridine nucleoside N-ribohydrolase
LSAVTISKCNPHSISFVDGFLRYNGYHDMPLGYAYNGVNPEDHMYLLPTLAAEYQGKKLLNPVQDINSGVEEGYVQIRKQLAQADDNSVVLVAVGPLTNIARLLQSGPDKISPLNGIDLVRQKVRSVSMMSGNMAQETPEWNVVQDLEASKVVYGKCPVSLIVSGFEVGGKILYPHQSILNDFGNPAASPLCIAYQHYMEMPYDRQCWDLTSVYDAFDADRSIYKRSERGTIHIDELGVSRFVAHPDGLHQYLIVDDADVQRAVKGLVRVVTMK